MFHAIPEMFHDTSRILGMAFEPSAGNAPEQAVTDLGGQVLQQH
jgi:hypothetical protein